MDKNSYNSMRGGNKFIAPAFLQYTPRLGAALTHFLYSDPNANPYARDPSNWHKAGVVSIYERKLDFLALGTSGTTTSTIDFTGGQNVVVLGFKATVVPDTPAPTSEPFHDRYVTIKQVRTSGWIEIETTPLYNVAGSGAWPAVTPIPQRWHGNVDRDITLDNNSGVTVDAFLCWQVASLDTGR